MTFIASSGKGALEQFCIPEPMSVGMRSITFCISCFAVVSGKAQSVEIENALRPALSSAAISFLQQNTKHTGPHQFLELTSLGHDGSNSELIEDVRPVHRSFLRQPVDEQPKHTVVALASESRPGDSVAKASDTTSETSENDKAIVNEEFLNSSSTSSAISTVDGSSRKTTPPYDDLVASNASLNSQVHEAATEIREVLLKSPAETSETSRLAAKVEGDEAPSVNETRAEKTDYTDVAPDELSSQQSDHIVANSTSAAVPSLAVNSTFSSPAVARSPKKACSVRDKDSPTCSVTAELSTLAKLGDTLLSFKESTLDGFMMGADVTVGEGPLKESNKIVGISAHSLSLQQPLQYSHIASTPVSQSIKFDSNVMSSIKIAGSKMHAPMSVSGTTNKIFASNKNNVMTIMMILFAGTLLFGYIGTFLVNVASGQQGWKALPFASWFQGQPSKMATSTHYEWGSQYGLEDQRQRYFY